MVPVRSVDDVFVPQFRIVAFEFADDIVRFERANLLLYLDGRCGFQRDRPESLCDRRLLQRIEILSAIGEQFFRNIARDPRTRFNRVHVLVWIIELEVFFAPA